MGLDTVTGALDRATKDEEAISPEFQFMASVASAVDGDGVGMHTVEVTFNYEPSRRLRMYQFDALHHDVAVWSIH